MSIYLADVSEYQPEINDATYVTWSHGIMIRALYGDAHVDDAWYGGARRADLHTAGIEFLGIYQYLVSGQSGTSQAQKRIRRNLLRAHHLRDAGETVVVCKVRQISRCVVWFTIPGWPPRSSMPI